MDAKETVVAVLALGALYCMSVAASYEEDIRVPFGVMFDVGSDSEQAAVEFKIYRHNVNDEKLGRVKLRSKDKRRFVNMKDVYSTNTEFCDLVRMGVFAVFGTHTSNTIDALKAYTSTLHMPLITPRLAVNTTGQDLGYGLFVRPYYPQAVLDVIEHYGWREVWYMLVDNDGLMRLQQLFDVMSRSSYVLKINILRITDVHSGWEALMSIDKRNNVNKNILLDMPLNDSEAILKKEKSQPGVVRHSYFLVDIGLDEIGLKFFEYGGMNVTGFRMVDPTSEEVKTFVSDWRSWRGSTSFERAGGKLSHTAAFAVDGIQALARGLARMKAHNPAVFKQSLRHDRVYNNGSADVLCDTDPVVPWRLGYDIMKMMRDSSFKGLTGNVAFDRFGLRTDYTMHVLAVTINMALSHIATWSDEGGLQPQSPDLIRIKPQGNVDNRTLIVTSILTEPFLSIKENAGELEGNDRYEGYCPDLALKLKEIMKFDYRIEVVKDAKYGSRADNGSWNGMVGELMRGTEPFLMPRDGHETDRSNDKYVGYCADFTKLLCAFINRNCEIRPVKDRKFGAQRPDGSWDGIVGEVIRREADMSIAPLTITAERELYMDFSKPFMSLGISIMIKKPTNEAPGVFSFMYPLSYEIWMCIIFAYIGVSVVLFLVSRFSPFEWHIEDNTDGPTVTNNFSIFNSLWFALGAFMQQGCDIEPRSMSGRIVGSVWWFFTLIIISSYTANLAAFLTVDRMRSSIESADDLAKQIEIKYGTVDSGSTKEFFRSSTFPVYERMWSFMSSAEESVFVSNNKEGIRRVREKDGKYAFLVESTTNEYTNQREPCDTMKVGNNLDSKGYGIGTQLGDPLQIRERVTLAVLELRESGELTKMENKWWYDKGECAREKTDKKEETTNALKLSNVAGIFYILIGGLSLALIMAGLEFLYKSNTEAKRRKTSFTNAVRTKARLSIKGKPDHRQSTADIKPVDKYTYTPAAQLITFDGYADANTHTQV